MPATDTAPVPAAAETAAGHAEETLAYVQKARALVQGVRPGPDKEAAEMIANDIYEAHAAATVAAVQERDYELSGAWLMARIARRFAQDRYCGLLSAVQTPGGAGCHCYGDAVCGCIAAAV